LIRGRAGVVERYGPWVAHNIHLGGGVYTIEADAVHQEVRLPLVVQVAADVLGRPIEGARVLDLACHEGLFGIELARRGADVLAVDAREQHVEKTRFAAEALGLERLETRLMDVRELTPDAVGRFDLVLCLGILYHLDTPDVFRFVEQLAELSSRAAIIDTHFSLRRKESRSYGGNTYWGTPIREHDPAASREEREDALGASIDNPESFWLTKPSLYNLVRRAGFTSAYEVRVPRSAYGGWDREILVAITGEPQDPMLAAPHVPASGGPDWPEDEKRRASRHQSRAGGLRRVLGKSLPEPIRRAYRRRRRP
jgi:SAM-dependent methyltransferase